MNGREKWKDIEGYEGLYQVSNYGRVKSLERKIWVNRFGGFTKTLQEKILKPSQTRGYHRVTLCKNHNLSYFSVHRLVAEAFINNPDKKLYINHKDGNKINNILNNLEWCTGSENCLHAYETGLKVSSKGEDVNGAKLTENEVLEIRSLYEQNWVTQKELSQAYDIDQGMISNIVNYKNWIHL